MSSAVASSCHAALAHHVGAQRGVGHLGADVDRVAAPVERVEVLGERLPVPRRCPRAARCRGCPRRPPSARSAGRASAGAHRGEADAAVAHDDGGDAVPADGVSMRVPGGLAVVVGVDVDEARASRAARRRRCSAGAGPSTVPTAVMRPPSMATSPVKARRAGAVDDASVPDDEIVHDTPRVSLAGTLPRPGRTTHHRRRTPSRAGPARCTTAMVSGAAGRGPCRQGSRGCGGQLMRRRSHRGQEHRLRRQCGRSDGGRGRGRQDRRTARRVIDAGGAAAHPGLRRHPHPLRRPGCWDQQVAPSCWHGVTTVVMGNCGVGFAPVRPDRTSWGPADGERRGHPGDGPARRHPVGLGDLRRVPRRHRHALQRSTSAPRCPTSALRHYVMGERCYDDANAEDMAAMAAITRQALADGALGFSTSRFYGHIDKAGNVVPGTHASADEMVAIAEAFAGFGHGTMEIISDHLDKPDELAWIEHIARITGRPLTFLVALEHRRGIWDLADRLNREGLADPAPGRRPPGVGADDARGHAQPDAAVPVLRRDQGPALRGAAPPPARPRVPGQGPGRRAPSGPASPTRTR